MDQRYLKNFGVWLGAPLLLSILLPLVGFYIFIFLKWIAIVGGTIIAIVMTQREIGKRISFKKAFIPIVLIVGGAVVLRTLITLVFWGFWDFEYLLIDFFSNLLLDIYIATMFLLITGIWYMYEKAGKPGWACIVPIYNFVVILEIAKKPTWWVAMLFIPIANIVFLVMTMDALAKAFKKDTGFTVGLVLLGQIFMAVLGFGSAEYMDGNTIHSPQHDDLLDSEI